MSAATTALQPILSPDTFRFPLVLPESGVQSVRQEYVLGFLFDEALERIVLIEKNRGWQKGRLNGLGGKIEPHETPLHAMVREFQEEAGAYVTNWTKFCVLKGSQATAPWSLTMQGFSVHCFRATGRRGLVENIDTVCDEGIVAHHLVGRYPRPTIPNLAWLIPMAVTTVSEAAGYEVTEQYKQTGAGAN